MPNSMTDELGFVQIIPVKSVLGWFGRTLSVADGFSLEVFRGDTYLGSIPSSDFTGIGTAQKTYERMRVRDNDTIFRINLGSKPLKMQGTLSTQDGYQPTYEVEVDIRVTHTQQFVKRYRQEDDPVRVARAALDGEFQRYARLRSHEQLKPEDLEYRTTHTLNVGSNKLIGLDVVQTNVTLRMDPRRAKEIEIDNNARLQKKEMRTDADLKNFGQQVNTEVRKVEVQSNAQIQQLEDEIARQRQEASTNFAQLQQVSQNEHLRIEERNRKNYERTEDRMHSEYLRSEEDAQNEHLRSEEDKQKAYLRLQQARQQEFDRREQSKHNEYTRVEEEKHQIHELEKEVRLGQHQRLQQLLEAVGIESTNAISRQVHEQILQGRSLSEVFNDFPELRDVFLAPSLSGNAKAISSSSSPLAIEGQVSNTLPLAPEGMYTEILSGILRQPMDTFHITQLGLYVLSVTLSQEQYIIAERDNTKAFLICVIDEDGPMDTLQLRVGDIIVALDELLVTDLHSLAEAFKTRKKQEALTLRVLRADTCITIQISDL